MRTESSLIKCPACILHYDPARNSPDCPHQRTESRPTYFVQNAHTWIQRNERFEPWTYAEDPTEPPVEIHREFWTRRIAQ